MLPPSWTTPMHHRSALTLALAALLALAGCDDDPMVDPDAGPRPDAPTTDPTPPTVRSTSPMEGESGIARDALLVVRFSEPMTPTLGEITVAPGGGSIAATDGEWDEVGSTLSVRPAGPWPSGEVTVTVTTSFEDESGNPLAAEHVLTFTTVDDIRPVVTASSPTEGANGLSARIDAVTLTFDERMDPTVGTLDILGGGGTLGAPAWSDDRTMVSFPAADFEYERDYDLVVRGFRDAAGNPLDGMPVLGDGILDFATGADADAPSVVRAEPMEGQLDVNPAAVDSVLVTFDEAMDPAVATVRLGDGTSSVALVGEWTAQNRVLRVDVRGRLAFETDYALDLTDLVDPAGNALQTEPYLGDGALDFSVSSDSFAPFVRSSDPTEGTGDVDFLETTAITLELSEAMDTSVAGATLVWPEGSTALTGTWTDSTHIRFDVTDLLRANTEYALDVTGLEDTLGNALDATHRYLGDGRLDFVTSEPFGEGCRDPLDLDQIMFDLSDGAIYWTIAASQVSERDGGTDACDASPTTDSPDALVRYDKISDDVASGGRYLRVVVDSGSNSSDFDVAIQTGATCDPARAPARCLANSIRHETFLDAPAGPVWIWVSRTSSSAFSTSVQVRVYEVDPPRAEGETCDAPYTTASSIYTAPSGAGEPHVWRIPENRLVSMDIGPSTVTDGSLVSCDPGGGHGIDGVVRFTKAAADSILRVTVDPQGSSSFTDVNVEVMDACDAGAGGTSRYGCLGSVGTEGRTALLEAPAGDLWLWVTADDTSPSRTSTIYRGFPETVLSIEEITDIQNGEVCSRALSATPGSNAVSATSDERLGAPSCFDAGSNVEWYRITTTQPVLIAAADAAGGVALVDATTQRELTCTTDAQARPAARYLPVGSDVCVAVEMGRSITDLPIFELAYGGLGGSAPVDLSIGRPLTGAGAEDSITGDDWMAVGASTLYMQYTAGAAGEGLDAPLSGGERAVYRSSADGLGSSNTGATGVFAAGQLFSFNDEAGATTNRLERIWDGSSAFWSPVEWDLSPSYPVERIAAATVNGTSIVYVTADDDPQIYSVSALAPARPTLLGSNTTIMDAMGIAMDDTYVYLAAALASDGTEGVFRIPITELGNPTFTPPNLTPGIDIDRSSSPSHDVPLFVDATSAPDHLYVRNAEGHFEVVTTPSVVPVYLGEVITLGNRDDQAAAYDPATGSLYVFQTETDPDGAFVRYDP